MAKKKLSPKIIISEQKDEFTPSELEGKLIDIKNHIDDLIGIYGPDARLYYDRYCWHQYDDSPTPTYFLKVDRLETDEEYGKRIEEIERIKQKQDEHNRREFERLKKLLKEK